LEQRLANELPGIALRALGALRGLMRGDRFSNPPNVEKLLAEIRRQVSPVLAFVEDYLRTDQGQEAAWISKAEIYAAYRVHAARCGVDRPPAMSRFFGELRAACPGLADHRPRLESGERPQALSAPRPITAMRSSGWICATRTDFITQANGSMSAASIARRSSVMCVSDRFSASTLNHSAIPPGRSLVRFHCAQCTNWPRRQRSQTRHGAWWCGGKMTCNNWPTRPGAPSYGAPACDYMLQSPLQR
jgi:hypothetical protein